MSEDINEFELIQKIHINYVNYRTIKQKNNNIIQCNNFEEYLSRYYKLNYNYYIELCNKYNFDVSN